MDIFQNIIRFRRKYPVIWVKTPKLCGGQGMMPFNRSALTSEIIDEIISRLNNAESVMVEEGIDTPLVESDNGCEDYNFRVFAVPGISNSLVPMDITVRIDLAGGPVNISLTAQGISYDEFIQKAQLSAERARKLRADTEGVSLLAANAIRQEVEILQREGIVVSRQADQMDLCGGDCMWRHDYSPVAIEMNGVFSGCLWHKDERLWNGGFQDRPGWTCRPFAENAIRRAREYKEQLARRSYDPVLLNCPGGGISVVQRRVP